VRGLRAGEGAAMSIGGWRAEGTAKHLAMEVLRASVACFVRWNRWARASGILWSIDLGVFEGLCAGARRMLLVVL